MRPPRPTPATIVCGNVGVLPVASASASALQVRPAGGRNRWSVARLNAAASPAPESKGRGQSDEPLTFAALLLIVIHIQRSFTDAQ
jgi:hypothetical protein